MKKAITITILLLCMLMGCSSCINIDDLGDSEYEVVE